MQAFYDLVASVNPTVAAITLSVAALGALYGFYRICEASVTTERLPFQRALYEALRGQGPGLFREVDVRVRHADGTEKLEKIEQRKTSRFYFRRRAGLLFVKSRRGYGRREIEAQLDKYAEEFLGPGQTFADLEEVTSRFWRLLGWRFVLYVDRTSRPIKKAIDSRVVQKKSD